MKNSTIQIRTPAQLKKNAKKAFAKMGIDLSSGINIYLQKVVLTMTIPFEVAAEHSYTKAQLQKMDREVRWALKHGKRHNSFEEMGRDILGDEDYEAWERESAARRRNEPVSARLPAAAALRIRRTEAAHRRHSARKRRSTPR